MQCSEGGGIVGRDCSSSRRRWSCSSHRLVSKWRCFLVGSAAILITSPLL